MTRTLWPILTGFTLWALAFIALYALHHLGCHFAWEPGLHRAVLVGAYLLALALLAGHLALQVRTLRRPGAAPTTMQRLGAGATIAALAATIVTLGPVPFLSICL